MLKVIDNATREVKSLDGLWRFAIGSDNLTSPWSTTLPGDMECPVPASYNDIFCNHPVRTHVGQVWYQRNVTIPRGWKDQRVFLRIGSATHYGEVYVNDKHVASHVGGYTPFEADLDVQPGEEVRITIGVDNTLTRHSIPPGEVTTDELGRKRQKYWHDFYNYSGLHRSVQLCSVPKTRIQDVTVVTDVEGSSGQVKYEIELEGKGDIKVELVDGSKVVGSASGASGTISVPNAKLWQPGAAYLYTLRARLTSNSSIIDEYSLPVGIRTIRVDGLKILVNEKPFYFRGFGKHEDMPVKGKGHDNAWMVHDFELMKWCGANSFRTSHYPYAEDVLEYADRQGILVVDETAAVGLNLHLGGGFFGKDPRDTFSKDFADDKTQAVHAQAIRELVARDKNHPSVVMWSITNEPGSQEKGAREYFEPLVKLARELDPTRPMTYANMGMATPDIDRIADLFDVIGINRYYGWYSETGDLELAEARLEKELKQWQEKFARPLIVFEYGADTATGQHSVQFERPWSEEYQVNLLDMYHRVFDRVEAVSGEHVWNFADFETTSGVVRVDGNRKGCFSRDRKPKMAAHLLKKRWTQKPVANGH